MLDECPAHFLNAATQDKLVMLNHLECVRQLEGEYPFVGVMLEKCTPEQQVAFKQTIVIGQARRLLQGVDASCFDEVRFSELLDALVRVDHFYREVGGVIGYQKMLLQLIAQKNQEPPRVAKYHSPSFIDISKETPQVHQAIEWGLEALPYLAEIYPLGGAADRLHLVDDATGCELPAAKLQFAGKTLLEHLIRDLQAREFLYFKRFGKQLITPLAIMTSQEKNNHQHVLEICEAFHWFGRPKESIRLFSQPLVPTVNSQGEWCLAGPLKPLLKPGGHGAIWKVAKDEGIFAWLQSLNRTKALVRQINNPIAGLDYGLLAFAGIGHKRDQTFGFASCPRLLKAAEGVNVLVEKADGIVLTNIEYCDFEKFGIRDQPLKETEPYSQFSSNTNILFADLQKLDAAVDRCPFPGLLINLKPGSYLNEKGERKEEVMARLESTMQNIADVFVEPKKDVLQTEHTFVTYNQRCKTISSAKKAYIPGKSLQETPENCFYELLQTNRSLLKRCGIALPDERELLESLHQGPECVFLYHPAFGPLYADIVQKLQGGSLGVGSELFLEIAHFQARNLQVQGSLRVIAKHPLGKLDANGKLLYDLEAPSCVLENVSIENQGVDWGASSPYWKMNLRRKESVSIIFKGKGKLLMQNTKLKGSQTIIIEDGEDKVIRY